MRTKRLLLTLGLCSKRSALKRGEYLKEKKVFASIGEQVRFQPRKVPLYPELIKIGNNVNISSGVMLVVHDALHLVYNHLQNTDTKMLEKVGCIEIGDNVFIATQVVIVGNVKIGSNVIVSAGSFVNKDLEAGGIYGGTPARRIGNFDDYWRKREQSVYPTVRNNQQITPEEIDNAWRDFYTTRE